MTQIPIVTEGSIPGILRAIKDIKSVLLGRVTFGDNIPAWIVTDTYAGAANTEFSLNHPLDTVPKGFIAYGLNMAVNIYAGPTPWTTQLIYLKSTLTPVTFKLIVF